MCCFQQFAVVVPALAFAPFGMPATVFWIYVCASLLFLVGLIKIFGELPQEHGVDKIMPFGRLFFAIPHGRFWFRAFHRHGEYCGPRSTLDSRAYVLGLSGGPRFSLRGAQYCRSRPGTAGCGSGRNDAVDLRTRHGHASRRCEPRQQIFLGPGAETTCLQRRRFRFRDVAVEHSAETAVARTAERRHWAAFPRFFVGIPSLFYGVEHLLHPEYVPGIPLQKLTPEWIPGRIFLSYFVGVILILAGVCLLVNKKTRMAATVFRAHDSADGVMDLPADAPRRAHRRGGAELFLRHTAFLRSHPAVGERDGKRKPLTCICSGRLHDRWTDRRRCASSESNRGSIE